ncbi:hypothetical protein [Nitrincola sp. MINF-07-Sa-05]|uniref:hypothetical protein n=1 Tax=Nitrincola salilacus TaxID=3400273 RepID=UPI003917E09B
MIFKGSLVLQLLLAIAFLGFGWQADQAMDKSGMGDAFEWHRLSVLSGAAFYGLTGVWLATIAFSVVSAKFRSSLNTV